MPTVNILPAIRESAEKIATPLWRPRHLIFLYIYFLNLFHEKDLKNRLKHGTRHFMSILDVYLKL